MAKSRKPRSDRYDVSGNVEAEYYDDEQLVLVNLLGIRNHEQLMLTEEDALARAYERLCAEVRVDTPLTNNLIRHVHAAIFAEIYAWAGRWRTVTISKPGITWPPAAFVAQTMDEFERNTLRKIRRESIQTDDDFCRLVAELQGEFLVVHPFREGNARTIKLVTNLLSAQTGRPLLIFDETEAGRRRYILAASEAFRKNYAPMEAVIREALALGKRR